jgi:hypothetical protein
MISNYLLDYGLFRLVKDSKRLTILTALPALYADAIDPIYVLGERLLPIVSGPTNATPQGRQVTVEEITDGTITQQGTAVAWALVDDPSQRLLAAGELFAAKPVSIGNAFNLEAFNIIFPGELPVPTPMMKG